MYLYLIYIYIWTGILKAQNHITGSFLTKCDNTTKIWNWFIDCILNIYFLCKKSNIVGTCPNLHTGDSNYTVDPYTSVTPLCTFSFMVTKKIIWKLQ